MSRTKVQICADQRASVVVIGGGMAGAWTAFQLIKSGIETILVTDQSGGRGGFQGATRRSAGSFNTTSLNREDLESYLQKLGCGQTHPSLAGALREHLSKGLAELGALVDLKPIKIGLTLPSGNGKEFLDIVCQRFCSLGGKILNGWVTRLIADEAICQGVQFESAEGIGKIRCHALVIASGGYSNLFARSVRTNCFGNVLGYYLQSGGIATNLEFLFKHGYGNMDTNLVTPTEELPGAEIYDKNNERVVWLEKVLFNRQGTTTHLQAVQFWLRNPESQFYIDRSYRLVYQKLLKLAVQLDDLNPEGGEYESTRARAIEETIAVFPAELRPQAQEIISGSLDQKYIGYETYEQLKPLFKVPAREKFRVQPFTYFSMGGLGHVDFATNLRGVFVTGEAMHDFGANRVGGLPWSLYLVSAYVIVEQIARQLSRAGEESDFALVEKRASFDPRLLKEIQQRLYEHQEKRLTKERAASCVEWFRGKREALQMQSDVLSDGISWLLVAEAILQCSICRTESRGFFFRFDFQEQDERLDRLYSCAWYDQALDRVSARLMPWVEVEERLRSGVGEIAPASRILSPAGI